MKDSRGEGDKDSGSDGDCEGDKDSGGNGDGKGDEDWDGEEIMNSEDGAAAL